MDKKLGELATILWHSAGRFVNWICDNEERIKIAFGIIGLIVLGMFLITAYSHPGFILAFVRVIFYIVLLTAIGLILVVWLHKARAK